MKKKICFIIESMGGGGTQKNLYRLINTFEKDETKVSLITFKKKKKEHFIFKTKIKRYYANVPLHSSNLISAIFNNLRRIQIIRTLLKSEKPNSLISFLPSTNVISIISSWGLNIKVIISERNDPERQKIKVIWYFLRFFLYRLTDTIICNSRNAKKFLDKISGNSKLSI